MVDRIIVKVLCFASARDAVGCSELQLELDGKANCATLKKELERKFPALDFKRNRVGLAVNKVYSKDDTMLNDGDIVAVIPPISGG
jgi:molybdopterin converting factor subunit 1